MGCKKFELFTDAYCYGPADLMQVHKDGSTMWVSFRDSAGKRFEATYEGCVYWRLGPEHSGLHLALVERVTAQELEKHPVILQALQKNATDVLQLLREWESAGLAFYLHIGAEAQEEYLVAAGSFRCREVR